MLCMPFLVSGRMEICMKKHLIFMIACLAACLLPFAGMAVRPTTVSTENKPLPGIPRLKAEGGGMNREFFQEFEEYFNSHFAFRNELVFLDAKVQGTLFHVSNVEAVTYGEDGWLYYSSTLDDYLGRSRMGAREVYNLAHNISLAQQYVEGQGADFVLAVPPNKNTLYGEHMPYHSSHIVDPVHSIDLLAPKLQGMGVPYADLLGMFRGETETLYLKRDSHWNGKGAAMAYSCIMDTLGYAHEDYADAPATRAKDADGDLNRMLYTFYGEKELDYKYSIPQNYAYTDGAGSVEDVWVGTEGGSGNGTLLMFRDSFGNTLIPLVAGQFQKAWFTKESPYGLASLMGQYRPDTVVFEKVERNLAEFLTMPPIIPAPETGAPQSAEPVESSTTISIGPLEFDANYYKISGEVDSGLLGEETDIIIQANGTCYQAYHTGANGYAAYIKKEDLPDAPVELKVLTKDQGAYRTVQTKKVEKGELFL